MVRLLNLAVAIVVALAVEILVPGTLAGEQAAQWTSHLEAGAAWPAAREMSLNIAFRGEFLGWARLDHTGTLTGHNMSETSSTESVVKPWLVADFLRRHDPTETELEQARKAIRWSDDEAAEALYVANGRDDSITRMIYMCGLTDTTVSHGWWSRTQTSPRDLIWLAQCLAGGTAAGPRWTSWLLHQMRHIQGSVNAGQQSQTRGGGRWGIIDGVPPPIAGTVAMKNGWTSLEADGNWHVNCLAFTDDWALAVMMRYPARQGLAYGAGICQNIAAAVTAS